MIEPQDDRESSSRALEQARADAAVARMRLAQAIRGGAEDVAALGAARERLQTMAAELEALRADVEALRADLRRQGETLATERAQAALREAALQREVAARDAQLAGQRETIARLQATLGEAGHRLVTRVGELLARHPRIAAVLRAPVRWFSRRVG